MSITTEVEEVISHYRPVMKRMGIEKSDTLLSGIATMKRYGVESYSERIVHKSGYSSIFCTSVQWAKIDKDEKFYEDYRNHLSLELTRIFHNRTTLISRSSDRVSTPFLKILNENGMNNSVIIHEFCGDRIKIIYYTGHPDNLEARDSIINNMGCLNWIRTHFQPALQDIFISKEFEERKELLLTPPVRKIIWHNNNNDLKDNIISSPIKYSDITLKELECLKYLRFGASNNAIADGLNISVGAVKYHLTNLKRKLSLTSRAELTKLAHDRSIVNISNLLRSDG